MPKLPYVNFHDINLNWFLREFKKIVAAVSKKQDAPTLPGSPGQVLGLDANQTPVWINRGGDVTDITIDQSSIVDQDGVAVIPIASSSKLGVSYASVGNGIGVLTNGGLYVYTPPNVTIKAGTDTKQPITPSNQDRSVYYGLAKIAGYDLANVSPLTPGVYPDAAIDKILTMLGVYNRILSPAGNTHTLLPCPFSYAFGEKAELNITVTATSEYHFSFSCPAGTPTVLTMTGATATAGDVVLEAGGYYEVNVWNGVALYRKVEVTGG